MSKALTCYARDISETIPDIHLPDLERVTLGRGPLTKIRDHKLSREQISLVANYEDYSIRLEVVGGNPSEARGFLLRNGEVTYLKHKESFKLLPHSYKFMCLFTPAPPESDEPGQDSAPPMKKQKLDSLMKEPTFKTLQSNDKREWIEVNKNEAQIMITPNARDPNPKLAVYDMDGTIITTKSGNVFPKNTDDWQIIYPTVPGKLKSLVKEGYKIVIYTNQAGVAKGKTSLTDIVTKIENIFLKRLGIPVAVLVCTSSGGFFRKPRTGLWEIFVSRYNGGLIDKSSSFYVGDAAGRDKGWKAGKKKDFSNSDRLFALNIEFQFHTPEEHFLGERPTENYTMPSFDPYNFKKPSSLLDPHDSELEVVNTQEVIMMVGMQGSGKSFFARKYFKNYVYASNDVSGNREKTLKILQNALSSGKSVIVDNTHPEAATRAKYLNIIAKYDDVRARCFVMNTNPSHARHNNLFRELIGEEHAKVNEILFNQYTNKFEPPQLTEGFHSIVSVNFIPKFSSEEQENLYNTHLLEK